MQLTLQTPALLFPAISLLLLAYYQPLFASGFADSPVARPAQSQTRPSHHRANRQPTISPGSHQKHAVDGSFQLIRLRFVHVRAVYRTRSYRQMAFHVFLAPDDGKPWFLDLGNSVIDGCAQFAPQRPRKRRKLMVVTLIELASRDQNRARRDKVRQTALHRFENRPRFLRSTTHPTKLPEL